LRPVTLGVVLGDDVEIASGLTAGESVVVDGADRLQNGARVEPQAAGASGGTSPPRKKSA
jgi:multidrug efflux system membrane fusion protein